MHILLFSSSPWLLSAASYSCLAQRLLEEKSRARVHTHTLSVTRYAMYPCGTTSN